MFKGGSLYLGTILKIPVKVHWSFALLLIYVIYVGQQLGMSTFAIINFFYFTLLIFVCVVLHEFGHALTARKYGIGTQDILITPIGGLARLDRLPENPLHEMVVAVAGPLVNVAIAGLIAMYLYFSGTGFDIIGDEKAVFEHFSNFPALLLYLNVVLVLFNLIPAFPMDGGRILRALISIFQGRKKGTLIASWIGRILAIGFLAFGLYENHLGLIFIGIFVYFAARAEYRTVASEERYRHGKVADVLNHNFMVFSQDDLMQDVFHQWEGSEENAILVADHNNNIIGIIPEEDVFHAREQGDVFTPVYRYMSKEFESVTMELPVRHLFYLFNNKSVQMLPVSRDGRILGVVRRQDLANFLTLRT
ncbi:MAG TPA: site-2 protease family protein [Membranihabitans sp.]|nr:site-2 protease family protein [Membranihabitans sp.]